ncbi:amidohydrolase family protein [Govanella unica]|uniref:Amidohydrolase n=1 Tax=Govanella unica TaxID=2975056 RepID=A0A9X3U0K1_9PROT|nr:amidohydrolase family protein [Govania unica]MDA5195042.1 amidohydrolase [Govania unica]
MIEDCLVVDSIVHAYNFSPENLTDPAAAQRIAGLLLGLQAAFSPKGEPQWLLKPENFLKGADIDLLANALFGESQVDICVFHELPIRLFRDGGSPMWAAREMRKRWPGRVLIYGAICPHADDPIGQIDRAVEEDGVIGIKLYPIDLIEGKMQGYDMADPELMFPLYEHMQKRGVKTVGIHKAIPFGGISIEPYRMADVGHAATAFPGLNFEIVHGGFAYLEETAMHLTHFPNVSVNLEATSAFIPTASRRFAEIIGTLIQAAGGADRIMFASGCTAIHPRPLIEGFWNLEMPEDLMENYNIPPLTKEMKRQILGENQARICGLDLAAMQKQFAGDEFDRKTALATPWSGGWVYA